MKNYRKFRSVNDEINRQRVEKNPYTSCMKKLRANKRGKTRKDTVKKKRNLTEQTYPHNNKKKTSKIPIHDRPDQKHTHYIQSRSTCAPIKSPLNSSHPSLGKKTYNIRWWEGGTVH